MEEIVALTMEFPGICKLFQEIKKSGHFYEKLKNSGNSEVSDWASRVDLAIDGEDIHKLWSNAITKGILTRSDMQLLLDTNKKDSGRLAIYAQSLG